MNSIDELHFITKIKYLLSKSRIRSVVVNYLNQDKIEFTYLILIQEVSYIID